MSNFTRFSMLAMFAAFSVASATNPTGQASGGASGGAASGGAILNVPGAPTELPADLFKTVTPDYEGVAYVPSSSSQVLDIYLPEGDGPFPAVIWVHGGAFAFGDQKSVNPIIGQALLDAGYAVVSVTYRVSGEALFPAAVQDVKAAVRFVRANADDYTLDPDRFAAFGESAGGNLAALIGTTGSLETAFDDPDRGNAEVSSAVKAVVDFFGPNDFSLIDTFLTDEGCEAGYINHDTTEGYESLYLGSALPEVPGLVAEANPVTYVSEDTPPFLIQNGTQDCNVGGGQGQLLADALDEVGVSFSRDLFQGAGHGGDAFYNEANAQRVIAFLELYVK